MNFYGYVDNSPVGLVDPTGKLPGAAVGLAPIGSSGGATVTGTEIATGSSGGMIGGAAALAIVDAALLWHVGNQMFQLEQAYGLMNIPPPTSSGNMVPNVGPDYVPERKPGRCKSQNGCKPCIPPVGTVVYDLHTVPPSVPHYPFAGTHWSLWEMHQSPTCQCFWVKLGVGQGPTPPLAQPMPGNAAGGGTQ